MNNKKNINGEYSDKIIDSQISTTELDIEKKKEIFDIINNKKFLIKKNRKYDTNSPKNQKDKYLKENDLLNFKNKDKNRTIKQELQKEKDNYLYRNYISNINPSKCGNVYCFCYINKYPLITIGPQFFYPIILFSLNIIIFVLVINFIFGKINVCLKMIELFLFLVLSFSQILTTLINEGIPKRVWFLSNEIINYLIEDENFYNEFNTNKYQICRKCNILIDKSLKIIHCDICNLCCELYDHHCPWIGKCVGKNNIWSFKIFASSNIIFLFFNIILLFIILINK